MTVTVRCRPLPRGLNIREPVCKVVREELEHPRLRRAIYWPQTEPASHYFDATLARQVDEQIWSDERCGTAPRRHVDGAPERRYDLQEAQMTEGEDRAVAMATTAIALG